MSNNIYSRWYNGSLMLYPGEHGTGINFFVDATSGLDTNNGLSWTTPKLTIQAAVDTCINSRGDTVYLTNGYTVGGVGDAGRGTDFTETVTVSTGNVTIIGVSPQSPGAFPGGYGGMLWSPASSGQHCLIVDAFNVRVKNISFEPDGAYAIYISSSDWAVQTGQEFQAADCWFMGLWNNADGGIFNGQLAGNGNDPVSWMHIHHCKFEYLHNVATNAYAIRAISGPAAYCNMSSITNCHFRECNGFIGIAGTSGSILDNRFDIVGEDYTATEIIDLRNSGGDRAFQIHGNEFNGVGAGAYTFAGGFRSSASAGAYVTGDHWDGNRIDPGAQTAVPADVTVEGWTRDAGPSA